MADITQNPADTRTGVAGFLEATYSFLASIGAANHRVQEVERLQALSDSKLAEMGLQRQDIARHVFRDMFYV